MTFDSVSGRAAGKTSGRVRRKLNTERATKELGDLETHSDAERWLKQLVIWGAGGRIAGSVLLACVSAVRVWKDLRESEASFDAIEDLRKDVQTLRDERDCAIRDLELARLGVK